MKNQPEYHLQTQVCGYIRLAYPNAMFMSDTIASVRLTFSQQNRNKAIQKSGFKCPDLIIFEPRGSYCGLFIELKVDSPYKKDGSLKSDKHLEGQFKTIQELSGKGYKCHFAWTFDMVKDIIDEYMS